MRTSLAILVVATTTALAADPPASGKYHVFVGTNTGGKAGSKGIYRCELDLKTGKLSEPEIAAELGSPSFLAIAPNGKTLYSVGEVGNAGPKKNEGGVHAFRIEAGSGKLTKLNDNTTGGPGPCHISTDAEAKFAIAANYSGGSTALFKLKPDGSFDSRTAFVQHAGASTDPKRTVPHAHCGFFDASGKHAFVCDLGLDQVIVYDIDRDSGTMKVGHVIKLPAGSGPRHIHLDEANHRAFVCGELDSTVNVVKYDLAKGTSEVTQSLSTLPDAKPVKGNSTAEIRIHPSGKFVYVSNRGHNSIAAFKNDDGKLSVIGHATDGIKVPRNFNIDPTGKWMLVASQSGDNVAVFEIGEDGLPKPTGNKVSVPQPVCVKFLGK